MTLRTLLVSLLLVCSLVLAGAAGAQTECRAEIGPARARVLVDRCRQASPATHPPCNASNPCDMIRSEIVRGCAFIASTPGSEKPPSWCKDYRE